MRVLLLEERAHVEVGHYPYWVVQLAAAERITGATLDPVDQSAYLEEFSPQALGRRLLEIATRQPDAAASRP